MSYLSTPYEIYRGGRVVRWCKVKLQCRGVLGPTTLAVGASGGLFGHFLLSSIISLFCLPLSGRRPDID